MGPIAAAILGQLAKAGTQALVGALPSVGGAIGTSGRVSRAERKLMRADVDKLRTGEGLGLTEAEKSAGVSNAILDAQAAQAALIDDARRRGDYRALASLGHQAAQAGALARQGLEQTSQALAQSRAEAIRQRMTARRQELRRQGEQALAGVDPSKGNETPGLSPEALASLAQSVWGSSP